MIEMLHPLKGEEGLIACGLKYRFVTIGEDGKLVDGPAKEAKTTPMPQPIPNPSSTIDNDGICECQNSDYEEEKKEDNPLNRHFSRLGEGLSPQKLIKMTRLFHEKSNTMITLTNRKEFIADGAMYEIVCRLAMEYSQEVMIRDGQMEWVTIAQDQVVDDNQSSMEPIRALVSTRLVEDESKLDQEPTLLIVTGKGHVRAGVFSRQHLLTSGLECSSAVQFVREAQKRTMNLIVLDPNARGDRFGMITFEKSMTHLFRRWEKEKKEVSTHDKASSTLEQRQQNLHVLSHSQSGAQFVRYLLDKSECYLSRIGAVAFTDSTHNIQWTKLKNQDALKHLLESEKSIYFKRSDKTYASKSLGKDTMVSSTDYVLKPVSSIGQVVDTDEFWKHRFGNIKTLCAGTSEHSLTNWFASVYIWDHFDQYIAANNRATERSGYTIH